MSQPDAQPDLDRAEAIRAELRDLNVYRLLERTRVYRPGHKRDVTSLTKFTLRTLARRAIALQDEVTDLDAILGPLVADTAPELLGRLGLVVETTSALLVAAGDNPNVSATRRPSPTSVARRP